MNRKNLIAVIISLVMILSACTPTDTGTAEKDQKKIESLAAQVAEGESKLEGIELEMEEKNNSIESYESLASEWAQTEESLVAVQSEYATYKDRMSPYEALDEAEAEARLLEAERITREEREAEQERQESIAASESKRLEEEERERAEEEAKGYETGITYTQLARTPDDYIGEKVKFKGTVIQVIEDPNSTTLELRIAVNNDYDNILYVILDQEILTQRVLDEDKVTICGISAGTITYESTGAGYITIPAVTVDLFEFN